MPLLTMFSFIAPPRGTYNCPLCFYTSVLAYSCVHAAVIFPSKQTKCVDVERNTDGCGCRSRSCAGSLRTVRGRRLRRWWRRRWLTVRYAAKAPWLWESSWAPPAGLHANQLCAWFPSPRKNFTTQRNAPQCHLRRMRKNTQHGTIQLLEERRWHAAGCRKLLRYRFLMMTFLWNGKCMRCVALLKHYVLTETSC